MRAPLPRRLCQRDGVLNAPVGIAKRWAGGGAPRIHVVDLDGAAQGKPVNAQTIGAIAAAVGAKRLMVLTDVTGVLDKEGELISETTLSEARALIEDGTIEGGMIPKVETCCRAVEGDVEGAVIIDGRVPHAVLVELFTAGGAGTLIKPDSTS